MNFPGSPVVKTLHFQCRQYDSVPAWGSKILHATWPKNQNIKQKQYCDKFNKDF